jgi:hypothetical protein
LYSSNPYRPPWPRGLARWSSRLPDGDEAHEHRRPGERGRIPTPMIAPIATCTDSSSPPPHRQPPRKVPSSARRSSCAPTMATSIGVLPARGSHEAAPRPAQCD